MTSLRLLAIAFGLTITGCSQEPKTYVVSGTVSLNGKALPAGDIIFRSKDPALGSDAGKIVDGRFEFRAKPGDKRVEIRYSEVVPGRTSPMGSPLKLEIVPAQYNDESKLSATVSPDGGNEIEFKLEGQR